MQFWYGLLLGLPLGALLLLVTVYWWAAMQQIGPPGEAFPGDDAEGAAQPRSLPGRSPLARHRRD